MNDMIDVDSLLDSTLDDLADLPEFKVFPNGAHRVTVNFEIKEVNGKSAVELKMRALETMELQDPTATPLAAGDEGSVLYMLNNEFGQGGLKVILKPLAQGFGTSGIRDTMEAAADAECVVVTKQRQNKDKTQTYLSVTNIALV